MQPICLKCFLPATARAASAAEEGITSRGSGSDAMIGRHLIALLVREIESAGTILWLRQRCRLGLQGIAEPQLVGARDPHELGQVSDVGLPTEFSDSLAGQLRGAPGGKLLAIEDRQAELQVLIALVGQDRRVRDRVDDARAEERRCVALANIDFGDSGSSDGLDAGGRIGGLG